MHPRILQGHVTTAIAFTLVVMVAGMAPAWADDTGILGRLFRLGGGSSESSSGNGVPNQSGGLPYGRNTDSAGSGVPATGSSPFSPAPVVSDFSGPPRAARHYSTAGQWARGAIDSEAACESGGHDRRSPVIALRAGPFQRRNPIWYVSAGFRRWNRY